MNSTKTFPNLQDHTRGAKSERPWRVYKRFSGWLADCYEYLGWEKKVARVRSCADYLSFKQCAVDGYKKLRRANFCSDPYCPSCVSCKSKKKFRDGLVIAAYLEHRHPNLQFLHLTLTVRNCKLDQLRKVQDRIKKAWKRFYQRKEFKQAFLGTAWSLEFTHNAEDNSYHPHLHVILAVGPEYFDQLKDYYLEQSQLLQLWRDCYRDQQIKFVNIKALDPSRSRSLKNHSPLSVGFAELSKYAIKPFSKKSKASYEKLLKRGELEPENITGHLWLRATIESSAKVVKTLTEQLKKVRFSGSTGIIRQAIKELKIEENPEKYTNQDLITADEDGQDPDKYCPHCGQKLLIVCYRWNPKLIDYILSDAWEDSG